MWIGIPVSLVSSCFGGCSCVVDGVGFIGLLFVVVVVVGRFIVLICCCCCCCCGNVGK